ncbi:glycerophosphodiester phosphodiesterase [Labrys wisconsinensis]|uniref:Glycerophosphoryl diester phosphodiesterase n=1 Tax=Labrys wisconsinensis TaxID=425677 RepID=A0ABU0J6E1_9HYPH|nr:glycerophosphodiester phosphodiesterase family protein [Labrys wisconsinensis]MDQ0469200.1 glycerophosphoryl diester phosphodiesterase [Labrys wisconsinensis]
MTTVPGDVVAGDGRADILPRPVWIRESLTAGRPLIIAHRGASASAPENTLRAFRAAQAGAADAIETDLWLTGDGRAVCTHDADIRDAAGRAVAVGALTRAALRAVRPDIPDLVEAGSVGLPILLDVKESDLSRFLRVLKAPEIAAEPHRFIVGVGTCEIACAVQRACPALAQVGLMREIDDFSDFARLSPAFWGRIHAHRATERQVARLRALGLGVMITCGRADGPVGDTDAADLRRLVALAPDALILNDPALAATFAGGRGDG